MSARGPKSSAGAPNFDLDAAVRALRAEQGSAAQALALEQRLAAALGRGALAGAGGAVSGAGAAWGGGLLLVLALAGLGALGAYAYQHGRAREQAHAPGGSSVQATLVAAVEPATLLERVQPVVAPVSAPPPERPRHASKRRPARKAKTAVPAAPSSAPSTAPGSAPNDVSGELALLERARAALRSDPQAALALTEQHASAYPRGMFAQEREVLAIEALLRKRARAQAFARAHAFVAGNPASPYALRIRTLLEQRPDAGGLSASPARQAPAAVDPAAEPTTR